MYWSAMRFTGAAVSARAEERRVAGAGERGGAPVGAGRAEQGQGREEPAGTSEPRHWEGHERLHG